MNELRTLLREAADAIACPDESPEYYPKLVGELRGLADALESFAEVAAENQAAQVQADAGFESFVQSLNMMRVYSPSAAPR